VIPLLVPGRIAAHKIFTSHHSGDRIKEQHANDMAVKRVWN